MPSTAFVSASAPVTPAAYSRQRQASDGPPPVTPQRIPRAHRHQDQLEKYFRSPYTPSSTLSTPYTPLGLRTPWSTDSSIDSAFTTPASTKSTHPHSNGHSNSPLAAHHLRKADKKGHVDHTEDWRSRANENGIRVGQGAHEAFDDDESGSFSSDGEPDFMMARPPELGSFPASPSLSRSRFPAVIAAPPLFSAAPRRPRSNTQILPPGSVLSAQPQTPARRTLAALNTPPPRASNVDLLKLKGSRTDPAYTRRRPAFDQSELFDIEENEYTPYPTTFPAQRLALPLALNDPFDGPGYASFDDHINQLSRLRTSGPFAQVHEAPPSPPQDDACPVCGNVASSLVELTPCDHTICSACFTSSLNIVGEKNMECAVCHLNVENFHMRTGSVLRNRLSPTPLQFGRDLDGLMEMDRPNYFDFQRSSTPNGSGARQVSRPTMLRIDNVPWDITPPAIRAWLKHPVKRVHVLLDRKGKTLSHAFVEMVDEDAARAALRTAQNSVLGRGKRARGVTVTRSAQQELMKSLFPSWRGHFDGDRPSVQGLSESEQLKALAAGLIEEGELKALLHLIRSPDSHFLKVPSLPFHSLISILSKFPGNVDGCQFWTPSTRDLLFDIAFSAIQILAAEDGKRRDFGDPDLLVQLLQVAIHCEAFTDHQRGTLANLVESPSSRTSPVSSASNLSSVSDFPMSMSIPTDFQHMPRYPMPTQHAPPASYGVLAREFNIDPHIIEALAHRLSSIH